MAVVILLGIFLAWILWYCLKQKRIRMKRSPQLPPGPKGWPLVGNILQIGGKPHLAFKKWAEEYGPLFTIQIAGKTAVVINDVKMMRELFGHPSATGNFETDVFQLVAKGPYGIINTSGKAWQEQRQFCVRNLRNYGFGKSTSMEPLILAEVEEVADRIKENILKAGGIVEIDQLFKVAVNNALWTIVSGERVLLDNQEMRDLTSDLMKGLQRTVQTGVFFLPWIKHVAPKWSGYDWLVSRSKVLHDFIQDVIRCHEKSYDQNAPRDLIDSYIKEIRSTKNPNSSFYGDGGARHATTAIAEIFVAGGGTLVHHLEWVAMYITHHPNVQSKMQAEIENVIGSQRQPSLQDKRNLPFTEAVLLEIFRIASMGPFGVVHRLLEDIPFQGYPLRRNPINSKHLLCPPQSSHLG